MARPSPSSPVASTSRIPYTSPSSPFSTPSLRTFSSSAPSLARTGRRGGGHAHLINPLLRQRLTNLTFLLAGVLSVATVSLTMSGSLKEAGLSPGCPARSVAGVAAQEERKRRLGEEQRAKEQQAGWWTKGRFLEDPPAVVQAGAASPVVPSLSPVPAAATARRQEKRAAAQRVEGGEGERMAGPREEERASSGWGWRTDERVV